jgi:hypothetical protein
VNLQQFFNVLKPFLASSTYAFCFVDVCGYHYARRWFIHAREIYEAWGKWSDKASRTFRREEEEDPWLFYMRGRG